MKRYIVVLILLWIVLPNVAQEPISELEARLSVIPGNLMQLEMVSYVDFENVVAGRPGAPQVTSWEEFAALDDPSVLNAAYMGIPIEPNFFIVIHAHAEHMPEVMGFNSFDVSAAVNAASLKIIWGDFDVNTVIAAHESRGFIVSELDDYPLLCSADGCDAGNQRSDSAVDNTNIFGGRYGFSQPTIVSEDMIASSSSYDMMISMVSDTTHVTDSLYVQTALDVIDNTEGLLIQATLLDGLRILPAAFGFAPSTMMAGMSAEQMEEAFASLEEAFEAFPRFNMVAISDHATETEQIVSVILTFNDEESAQIAADILPRRIETENLIFPAEPFTTRLERYDGTYETSVFTSERTGYSAAVITFRAPLADNELIPIEGIMMPSSRLYGFVMQIVSNNDLRWLAPEWE